MDHQLSNALSTMFLRRLVMFLHFETYVFENPQNPLSTDFHIYMRKEVKLVYRFVTGSRILGIFEHICFKV